MTLLLDAGAFLAVERGDRRLSSRIAGEHHAGRLPRTHGGVVGQVWRGRHGRQGPLARLLAGVDVAPLDDERGRGAGLLLGRAGTSDVVDAALVLLADDGDEIVTSDPDDLARLVAAAGRHVDLIPV